MIRFPGEPARTVSMPRREICMMARFEPVGDRDCWRMAAFWLISLLCLVVFVGPQRVWGMPPEAARQPDDQRQQVFQSWLGIGPNQPQNRERLQEKGERWIDLVDEICDLMPNQRSKLMLALAADLQGLDRSIESARLRFYELVPSDRDVTTVWNDRELNRQLSSIISAVHQQRTNLLTDGSLLVAAQSAILAPDQQQRWQAFRQQRQQQLHELFVRQWIVALDQEFPLAAGHREAFYRTLLEITQPPDVQESQFFAYLQRQLWQIDIERLAELYSPAEQALIKQTLAWTQQQFDRQVQDFPKLGAANAPIMLQPGRIEVRGNALRADRIEVRGNVLQVEVVVEDAAKAEAVEKVPAAEDAKR
jgi:hypothetical protein